MKYYRKYIQFNDLVFGSSITQSDDIDVSYDIVKHRYTFRNGDYAPLKRRTPRIESTTVGLTLEFNFKQIACDLRDFFRRFIVEQLSKAGKLWAVQGKELLWAYAIPESYSEPTQNLWKNTLEVDVQFYLPQGVWHKADRQRTFLIDFDMCEFLRCYDYQDANPCCDCAICGSKGHTCCCCESLLKDDALCYNIDRLSDVYGTGCSPSFIVKYDCQRAEALFTDEVNPFLGQRVCRESDEEVIAGQLYYAGDIPSDSYRITINGASVNPRFIVNGNENWVKGEFDSPISIDGNGNVYDQCGELLGADIYQVQDSSVLGFEFVPGMNSIIIEPNICCDTRCVYFQIDELTV